MVRKSHTLLSYHTKPRFKLFVIPPYIIDLIKVFKGAYWISSNSSFIQYCDSNIRLFSIAPPLVIALPTLR